MTIASQLNRTSLDGNGVTTTVPIAFPFHSPSDLVVLLVVIATDVQTAQTIITHYNVIGTPDALGHYVNGGSVVMVTAPSALQRVVVYRDPARTQPLDLVDNDNLPAESVEAAIDYQTMLIQRVADLIGRTLRQPDGDSAAIATIPNKVDRASLFLGFNSVGDPIAGAAVDSVPVSGFVSPALDDTTLAQFFASLGVLYLPWTPTLTFTTPGDLTVVYGGRVGGYVQLGPLVFLWFMVTASTFTHTTASGSFNITGLPVPNDNLGGGGPWQMGAMMFQGITLANYTQFTPTIVTGQQAIVIQCSGSGQALQTLSTSGLPTGSAKTLFGHVMYLADT